jgi:hypothetical protein
MSAAQTGTPGMSAGNVRNVDGDVVLAYPR